MEKVVELHIPIKSNGRNQAGTEKQVITPAKGHIQVDSSICGGCRTCEAICSTLKESISNPELSRIYVKKDILGGYVCQPIPCRQCDAPACLFACPNGAIYIDGVTGARVVDEEKCKGSKLCIKACPITPPRIKFNKEKMVSFKCDLCGGDPQCVKFCPMGALTYKVEER